MIRNTPRITKVHPNRVRYGTFYQLSKHEELLLHEEVQGKVTSHEILEINREIGVARDVRKNGVILRRPGVEGDG